MFIFNLATESLPWTRVKRTKSPSKEKAERAAECQYSVCKLYFRQTASTMFTHIIVGLFRDVLMNSMSGESPQWIAI